MSKESTPVHGHQRGLDELLVHLVREVGLQRPAVEMELAGARHQTNPDHSLLAAADGLDRTVDDDRLARGAASAAGASVSVAVSSTGASVTSSVVSVVSLTGPPA